MRAGVSEQIAMKVSGRKARAVFDRYDVGGGRDVSDAVAKLSAYHELQNTATR